jgi:hypothetical protein
MNFKFMPELAWHLGYPFALLLMASVAGGILMWFRHKGWIGGGGGGDAAGRPREPAKEPAKEQADRARQHDEERGREPPPRREQGS